MDRKNLPLVFSDWLKHRRKTLDLTQDELAHRSGCSVSALRKIETGERRPSKQLAELLAKELEIPPEDRATFIRIARGELMVDRLRQPLRETRAQIAEVTDLRETKPAALPASRQALPLSPPRIPLQSTPLIGRDIEFGALERLYTDPECRLLTLTGIGGIGKTRLAIEFGTHTLSSFPGGVFYVPLTSVNSPEKIVPTIADVFGLSFSGPSDPKEQLFSYLNSYIQQEALLILDNLEHLIPLSPRSPGELRVVDLVSEILQRLPLVKILGTSRERLNLHGEWTYELHGLSIPPTDFVGKLDDYKAYTLFVKCAQRISADFQITIEDQPWLIQICQLVEGVPLALELAAAWVGILSCQEIAQEIQTNMDFLTTSMRDVPERHRSIRATFDHSWKLLTGEERFALCQLAVFHGGFDRQAALKIAGASLTLLASLSAKSLVRRAGSRYDLHEVIRQYALMHLHEHPQHAQTYARFSDYYLALLHSHERRLKSAAQQDAMRLLTDDIDNIRAAWEWAIQQRKFNQLEQAARAFGWYFEIAGLYLAGINQLELLVQALRGEKHTTQWHRLLGLTFIQQALLFFRKGEFQRAQDLEQEGIFLLRRSGDLAFLADGLIISGTILQLNGDYPGARSLLEEGLAYARAADQPWLVAFAVFVLGHIEGITGDPEQGFEQMMAGLKIWRTVGDPHFIALGLNFSIPALVKLGRYAEAKAYMLESIALSEQSKNWWGMGTAYRFLGLATMGEGNYVEAQAYIQKSLDIFGNFAVGWDIARSLTYLGDAIRLAGDDSRAMKVYIEALKVSTDCKALPIIMDVLVGLGSLQAQAGKLEPAFSICNFVLNQPASEEETKSRASQLCKGLEPGLSPEYVRTAGAAAQEESLDMVVNKILEAGW